MAVMPNSAPQYPDIAAEMSRRDRVMRHIYSRMSPQERLDRARALHEWAWREMESNPEGFERYYRRNLRQRAENAHGLSQGSN
jgi:hypothetical protein